MLKHSHRNLAGKNFPSKHIRYNNSYHHDMFLFTNPSYVRMARIARVSTRVLKKAEKTLQQGGGSPKAVVALSVQGQVRISALLKEWGFSHATAGQVIEEKLLTSIEELNSQLYDVLGKLDYTHEGGAAMLGNRMLEHAHHPQGFFLKEDAFIRLLRKNPPQKIMQLRSCASIDELIAKEDVMHIGAALRFVEDSEWINSVFFSAYAELTPDDFEERPIRIIPLDASWEDAATHFVQKKYHNISHLKELGVIFIIPTSRVFQGQFLRTVLLLLHYINEVSFYSSLFRSAAGRVHTFAQECMSLLRGDVLEDKTKLPAHSWLIDQRYLEKGNEDDWRLFVPRVNPEALHWMRAERMLQEFSVSYPALVPVLSAWKDTSWLGDFFPSAHGGDALVSFNIIDASMSLVREKDGVAYRYHVREALWNAIFMQAMGEEKMDQLIREHIIRGYIPL